MDSPTTSMSSPPIVSLPYEILNKISLEVAAASLLGPPVDFIMLMRTCSALYTQLKPILGAVYRYKLDVGAAIRRTGRPTSEEWEIWGRKAFEAMIVVRLGDIRCDEATLLEALRVLVVLMLDDDGKNSRQLLLWARADNFVQRLVLGRLYERAETNDGWPRDTPLIAYALQLMWLLTSEESLLSEPPAIRAQIQQIFMPYIFAPFRFPCSPFPPNHYIVPPLLPPTLDSQTTIPTAHGPYPLYPPSFASPFTLYGSNAKQVLLSPPLPALSAKMLYLARLEVCPIAIPPHLDRTRADRMARGVFDVAPVQEDLEEADWAWIAKPPMGTGLRTRDGVRKVHPEWNGLEWSNQLDEPEEYPQRPGRLVFSGSEDQLPIPRWKGKAPLYDMEEKSKKWDMDLARMVACGQLDLGIPRKVFDGGVYKLGTAEGLYAGRLIQPQRDRLEALAANPMHPPHHDFTPEALDTFQQFASMRMSELHGLQSESSFPPDQMPCLAPQIEDQDDEVEGEEDDEGEDEGDDDVIQPYDYASDDDDHVQEEEEEEEEEPFGLGPLSMHDGMNNAWFAGSDRPRFLPPAARSQPGQIRVAVGGVPGVSTYRVNEKFGRKWKDAKRLGNDAPQPMPSSSIVEEEERYDHDSSHCSRCKEDEAFATKLRETFGTRGDDACALLDAGRARGRCNGVKEIIIRGETDFEHGAAFHHYVLEGRVRPADGLFLGLRRPKDLSLDLGTLLFWGYFVGGETLVGNWRTGGQDPGAPAWEGTLVLGRRED